MSKPTMSKAKTQGHASSHQPSLRILAPQKQAENEQLILRLAVPPKQDRLHPAQQPIWLLPANTEANLLHRTSVLTRLSSSGCQRQTLAEQRKTEAAADTCAK